MNKVTIIGTGSVGSTIAYTLTVMGLASEIVMIDINYSKAFGEAMDICQGTPFCTPCAIHAGSYLDSKDSDVVIITSGVARRPGQSRLDLAQTNIDVLKQIIPEITRFAPNATYIIVSNPVDILTYTFCKRSGIPENRIIGSGTILDTSRLRTRLSEHFSINQRNVHAYVLGEHGDSSFIPWSLANVSNVPVTEYHRSVINPDTVLKPLNMDEVEQYVRKSGARVIESKGATYYAVSVSVCHIVKCILTGIDTTMTVSTMLKGEYGISDVCLSLLNIVGNHGVESKILLPLNDKEIAALHHSADCLKEIIRSVDI